MLFTYIAITILSLGLLVDTIDISESVLDRRGNRPNINSKRKNRTKWKWYLNNNTRLNHSERTISFWALLRIPLKVTSVVAIDLLALYLTLDQILVARKNLKNH